MRTLIHSLKPTLKYFLWFVLLVLVLTGCSSTQAPITGETEGFFNHYFVYSFSRLIMGAAHILGGSYGIAIIVITLLIRFFLLPLNLSQYKQQKRMQILKPKMDEIKEKYDKTKKDDQAKQQQEIMKLFQQEGVNPLSGCLPMIVQLPILMAFYYAIARTQEIAVHNFLWFSLGQADPIHILPIIAALTTFTQVKLSQAQMEAANPQMRVMQVMMPIMIFTFALKMPAALPLYWIVGNVFMILQTVILRRA
ncbi:membrane protein insertase YidC [Bacillus tianshenii]|nr:membrane protein insertase YidC [Bacillus tianshenii]